MYVLHEILVRLYGKPIVAIFNKHIQRQLNGTFNVNSMKIFSFNSMKIQLQFNENI